jgi:hypothetical protein
MLKTIVLTLMFQDGYLGGHVTASYFETRAQCQKAGEKVAMQYISYGHPATFLCAPAPKAPKTKPGQPIVPPRQFNMPTGITP